MSRDYTILKLKPYKSVFVKIIANLVSLWTLDINLIFFNKLFLSIKLSWENLEVILIYYSFIYTMRFTLDKH